MSQPPRHRVSTSHRQDAASQWQVPDADSIDWAKGDGLVPAIVQDADTAQVLMLGYMNRAALEQTVTRGQVVFYSRSRQKLWTKGETSGHFLTLVDVALDCDGDTLLVQARRNGPVCHTGSRTCWGQEAPAGVGFVAELARIIAQRARTAAETDDAGNSYTAQLLHSGTARIAQKVGEEGVETALAAVTADRTALVGEAADLLYHLLVLLQDRGVTVDEVVQCLRQRHQKTQSR